MNVSALFIKRPVTTTLVLLGLLVFGGMAYRLLPVSDLPNVDFPAIFVSAAVPGASPETMASSVALPLEKQFSTIAGLNSMSSSSQQGLTRITLQFDLNRDIDAAAQDVQSMIAKAQRQLPPQMPAPPSYQKVNPADQPVMMLVLSSKTLPLSAVDEFAQSVLAQRLSTLSGVAQVNVVAGQKFAVRIDLDPRSLAAHGIGIDEVATGVTNANVNLPTGTIYGPDRTLVVQADGQLLRADAYKPAIIAYRNGNPIRLEQVAHIYDGVEQDKQASWYNGEDRCIYLQIQKQPGTNVVAVVDEIRKLLPSLSAQMPAAAKLDIMSDRSVSIRASVSDVKRTLMITVGLVVLVIFLFLRNFSATIIPSLALPASIVATFAAMYLLGYSLDNLSLMALTLSVGFVVDDAIVMLENIVRHMEMGKPPMRAAFDGSKEVAFTILSMTISLAAVFIPVLFMGGLVGRLLHEFAVTIGVAILVSGFVSISLTPMLCSRFLSPPGEHGRLFRLTERVFDAWLWLYDVTLRFSLRWRAATVAVSIVLLAATVHLFTIVPKGFLPSEDQGRFNGQTEAIQGIGFEDVARHQQAIGDILRADPNVARFTNQAGQNDAGGAMNGGRFNVELKPRAERTLSVDQVINELRPKMAGVPGMRTFMVNPPPINVGGRQARSLYQLSLESTDTGELYRWSRVLENRMRGLTMIEDVNSDLQDQNPQLSLRLNRDKISALGLTVNQVETALYSAYGTRQVSQIFAPNNQYQVIMQVAPEFQRDASALSLLYVRNSGGRLIPLDTVVERTLSNGPLAVNHSGQLPSVTISFNLKEGVALGDAVDAIQAVAASTLPSTVSASFQGVAQAFQDSLQGLGLILLMAIVVIYIVLGVLYESFTHPLTILSGLPSAGFGALLTLLLFKMDLSLYAFVGIIMLVGLVKKNGIMMVDFAVQAQREHGKEPLEAIHEACLVRFRPIMMTTMSALVGTLPIAVGWGAGAESRRPLGMAVVGGLIVSQLLTLYITPAYYVYIEHARMWLMQRRTKGTARPERREPAAPAPSEVPISLRKIEGTVDT